MLASASYVSHLVTWAVAFAILGGLPKVIFLFFPDEWSRYTLSVASGGKPVYAGETIHWVLDEWDQRTLPKPTARLAFAAVEEIDRFAPRCWSRTRGEGERFAQSEPPNNSEMPANPRRDAPVWRV